MDTIFLLAQDQGGNAGLLFGLGGLVLGVILAVVMGKVMGIQIVAQSRRQAQDLLDKAQSEAQTLKKQAELDGLNELAKRRVN